MTNNNSRTPRRTSTGARWFVGFIVIILIALGIWWGWDWWGYGPRTSYRPTAAPVATMGGAPATMGAPATAGAGAPANNGTAAPVAPAGGTNGTAH